jgi:hypothetical protein
MMFVASDSPAPSALAEYCKLVRSDPPNVSFVDTFFSVVALAYKATKEVIAICFAPTESAAFSDGRRVSRNDGLAALYIWGRSGTHYEIRPRIGNWVDDTVRPLHGRLDGPGPVFTIAGGFKLGAANKADPTFRSASTNETVDSLVDVRYRPSLCQAMADISGAEVSFGGKAFAPVPSRFELTNIGGGGGLFTVGLAVHKDWKGSLPYLMRRTQMIEECVARARRQDWQRFRRASL